MRKIILIFMALMCVAYSHARGGFDRNIQGSLFVPKGTWSSGLSFPIWSWKVIITSFLY